MARHTVFTSTTNKEMRCRNRLSQNSILWFAKVLLLKSILWQVGNSLVGVAEWVHFLLFFLSIQRKIKAHMQSHPDVFQYVLELCQLSFVTYASYSCALSIVLTAICLRLFYGEVYFLCWLQFCHLKRETLTIWLVINISYNKAINYSIVLTGYFRSMNI